jgi:hypothetical protein
LRSYAGWWLLSRWAWLATGVLAFAAVQLGLALWMYGRLPRVGPSGGRVATLHRLLGVGAILLTLPIAYHCILAYGVQTQIDTRVEVHSLAGCFLYGAIAAKILIVRTKRFAVRSFIVHRGHGP